MTDALLEIRDLRAGYGEVDILRGIDLTVPRGSIVTIAGTNGAGKSTLIKAVMGLVPRVEGAVTFEGRPIGGLKTEARLGQGIGYIPQVANVFRELTVLENLLVMPVPAPRRRAGELFERFPVLAERRRRRAGSLSGGERQQLALARALMAEPRLLLLDEPTAALAPSLVDATFRLIADLPAAGVTALVVEQRARLCLAISDHGFILDGGKVVMSGPAKDLLADESMADLYLGRHRQKRD